MRLELEQDPSMTAFAEPASAEAAAESRAAESVQYLREGIRAAQSGNRAAARPALLRAADLDPRSESAWLWLSSISEYPEELYVFLSNVLEINPENARALEWAAATRSLLAKNFVQRGIDAAEADQPDAAAQYFNQALEHDEHNPMAWLWLASLSDSNEGKISYLEKVLEFDPENQAAGAAYKAARDAIRAGLLSEARMAAVAGNNAEAHELLDAILAEEPNAEDAWVLRSHLANGFEDKIEALKRVVEINPDNAGAKANLESLASIMEAVAPKAAAVEAVEETAAPVEEAAQPESPFAADETPAEAFSEPSWMTETADTEPAVEEASYDGTIEVNYAAETAEDETVSPSAGFVDTDAVSEFESSNEGPGFAPAEPFETPDMTFTAEETEAPVQEAAEEITYDLAPEPEAETVTPSWLDASSTESFSEETKPAWASEVDEAAELAAPAENPFTEDASAPAVDSFPTLTSISIDPEMLKNVNELFSADLAPVSMPATEPVESASVEMPFGMTMIGGRVPAPEENDGFDLPFGMTMMGGHMPAPEENDSLDVPFDIAKFRTTIPMPEGDLSSPVPAAPTGYETRVVRSETPRAAQSATPCSFCSFENDGQAIACNGCMAVLTLADLEMLLANHHADKMTLRVAVERMESERTSRTFTEAELTMLGIGHLNLRNLQYGYNYLYEASQMNPNNVVLASQVNALLIRLEEIKQQDLVHESMVKGKKILVVDDSPTVRKLIAGKLEKCGHDVFCSNDGVEAMERLAELRPDLILLDITMPRMDGYQVCKLIRSNEATKDVPVVMISGKDGFFDKVRGRMAGSSGYITKPFGPETLMKAVESYLNPPAA